MSEKDDDRFELTELFMAKAGKTGWDRCYHGTIKRETDDEGKLFVFSRIKVNQGNICSRASDQWILGEKLDDMVLMILDYGLHSDSGVTSVIAGSSYFLN